MEAGRRPRDLRRTDPPMKPPRRARHLSDLAPKALGPVVAKQGFASSEIVARWELIAGPELAAVTVPVKIVAPRRGAAADPSAPPEPSTLLVRVEGAFALELQHRAAELMERVNAHLGWACVGALKLRQGPVAGFRRQPRRTTPTPPIPTPDERATVRAAAAQVEEAALNDALVRLGEAVLARTRVTRA